MFKISTLCILLGLSIDGCSMKPDGFGEFLSIFELVDLPINMDEKAGEIHFEKGLPNINEEYVKEYLHIEGDWGVDGFYSYNAVLRFEIDSIVCVVYRRNYLPENIAEEKIEYVLNTYYSEDFVASEVIQASYGDDYKSRCVVKRNLEIEVFEELITIDPDGDESIEENLLKKMFIDSKSGFIMTK